MTCPSGAWSMDRPLPGTYWRVSKEKLLEMNQGRTDLVGQGGQWYATAQALPLRCEARAACRRRSGRTSEVGHTQDAKKELMEYVTSSTPTTCSTRSSRSLSFGECFSFRPVGQDGELVLDFFAGSGPTGHGVIVQNAEDGGNRRFVLFNFPSRCQSQRRRSKPLRISPRSACGG